jgi:transposase
MTATGVRFDVEAERRKLGAMTAGELRRRYQEIGGDEARSRARGRPGATDGSRVSVGPSPKV